MTKRFTWIVATDPVEGRETDFEAWYAQHLLDITSCPGVVSGRRFHTRPVNHTGEPSRSHVALYEIETDDPDALLDYMVQRMKTGEFATSDAVQPGALSFFCEPI